MITLVEQDSRLKSLFQKYNILLRESAFLEDRVDNPGYSFRQRSGVMELQKITREMNETINLIKEYGHNLSENELANGFPRILLNETF